MATSTRRTCTSGGGRSSVPNAVRILRISSGAICEGRRTDAALRQGWVTLAGLAGGLGLADSIISRPDPPIRTSRRWKEGETLMKKSRGGRMTAAKKRAAKKPGGKGKVANRKAG